MRCRVMGSRLLPFGACAEVRGESMFHVAENRMAMHGKVQRKEPAEIDGQSMCLTVTRLLTGVKVVNSVPSSQ